MKLLLLTFLVVSQSQWINTYEAFVEDSLTTLDGWVIQNQFQATSDIITKCNEKTIIGGLKTFGLKTTATKFIKLPPHYKLKFNIQLWKLGEWEKEVFSIYIDGVPWEMKWGFTEGGIRLCGGPESKHSDKIFDIEFEIAHNSPTVTIILATNQQGQADIQAWGFRQVKVSFFACPSECGICHNDKAEDCKNWNQEALSWFHIDTKLEGWQLENGKDKGYECSGIVIFGGYENVGAKSTLSNSFISIAPHYKIMIKFTFWKIDLWDNDEFYIKIDDKEVRKIAFQTTDGIELCGVKSNNPGYGEKIVAIEVIQKHSEPTLKISFSSSLSKDLNQQSWGIRDFFLFAAQCTKFCDECVGNAENECTKCHSTHTLSNGKCLNKNEWYVASKEFFEEESFKKVEGWNFQELDSVSPNPPITKCSDLNLIGGYQSFGKKTTVSKKFILPKHDYIRVKIIIYKIDNWDGEELTIFIDNNELWTQFLGWNDPAQSDICGNKSNNWKERIMKVDKILTHSSAELQLDFRSTLQKEANEASWGFREFQLLYSPLNECIEVFSECNYKGLQERICENTESLTQSKIQFDIKSIKIPEGMKITGYRNLGFKGDKVEYETNQECLDTIEFSFIEKQLIGNMKYIHK
ncbi:unnamed protein product [Paramecium primaurelia]|uniref:Uncharacterized protein n=1 Tax=Paramecium primaurelia TaxID=5886 RepID=A0A8S1PSD1_PARPR|nr:unnamed protein product [Paramecium primaurelia]